MPVWAVFLMTIASGYVTVLSVRGTREASRTGRQRFLFWRIPGWGERDRNPWFFRFVQFDNYYRTSFFALLTIVSTAYLLEALGLIR